MKDQFQTLLPPSFIFCLVLPPIHIPVTSSCFLDITVHGMQVKGEAESCSKELAVEMWSVSEIFVNVYLETMVLNVPLIGADWLDNVCFPICTI